MHGYGAPTPLEGAPAIFPLALIDEGRVGVSLFMTSSGDPFTRLLDGRRLDYGAFLANRAIRLFPLLAIVTLFGSVTAAFQGYDVTGLALRVVKGFVLPTWPNGGWSIAVELHFYILPPLLLIAIARNIWWGVAMIAAALTRRAAIYHSEVPPTLHS